MDDASSMYSMSTTAVSCVSGPVFHSSVNPLNPPTVLNNPQIQQTNIQQNPGKKPVNQVKNSQVKESSRKSVREKQPSFLARDSSPPSINEKEPSAKSNENRVS